MITGLGVFFSSRLALNRDNVSYYAELRPCDLAAELTSNNQRQVQGLSGVESQN
jgi:hypothetical protein